MLTDVPQDRTATQHLVLFGAPNSRCHRRDADGCDRDGRAPCFRDLELEINELTGTKNTKENHDEHEAGVSSPPHYTGHPGNNDGQRKPGPGELDGLQQEDGADGRREMFQVKLLRFNDTEIPVGEEVRENVLRIPHGAGAEEDPSGAREDERADEHDAAARQGRFG